MKAHHCQVRTVRAIEWARSTSVRYSNPFCIANAILSISTFLTANSSSLSISFSSSFEQFKNSSAKCNASEAFKGGSRLDEAIHGVDDATTRHVGDKSEGLREMAARSSKIEFRVKVVISTLRIARVDCG